MDRGDTVSPIDVYLFQMLFPSMLFTYFRRLYYTSIRCNIKAPYLAAPKLAAEVVVGSCLASWVMSCRAPARDWIPPWVMKDCCHSLSEGQGAVVVMKASRI